MVERDRGRSDALNFRITGRLQPPKNRLHYPRRDQAHRANNHHSPQEGQGNYILQVEVIAQERNRNQKSDCRPNFGKNHPHMPRSDLERDHDELVQYQDGEGYSYHSLEVIKTDQDLREALDDSTLVDGDEDPDENVR